MARTPYDNHLQVFRGSKLPLGVFAKHAGVGCCGNTMGVTYDRLADVVHGPNSHAHLNPTSFNDKYLFPIGPVGGTLERDQEDIVSYINEVGVGAKIGVLCIPTYAFVNTIGIRIEAEEPGLTFNLLTRNGLALPSKRIYKVETAPVDGAPCEMARTLTETGGNATVSGNAQVDTTTGKGTIDGVATDNSGDMSVFKNFGALGNNVMIDILGRDGEGCFALESDEIMLEVASMPVSKRVVGNFRIVVAVNYSICDRAEREL